MTANKERIKFLEQSIEHAREVYYNGSEDADTVPDAVFDAWVDELRLLSPSSNCLRAVGYPASSEWKKANHDIPMGSLDKVNTPEELLRWARTVNASEMFVTEKLDGISIEVIYREGELVQAITRGDGFVGDDITPNVVKMKGVLRRIPDFSGSLRGEIIMEKSVHAKHFSDKSNPRNAASGISKRLDGEGCQHLKILFYQHISIVEYSSEKEQFEQLISMGLTVPPYKVTPISEVSSLWEEYQASTRSQIDYDIDGLVIRVNDYKHQADLGEKDMRPKGAVAFKFRNEAQPSVLRSIVWQVGASGRITPVAEVDPVKLVGAVVERASLYNVAYIQQLGIDIGARVLVTRANDVIPRIEAVLEASGSVAAYPKSCPCCGAPTVFEGENLVCTDAVGCPEQVKGRIRNWISTLNILEWGDVLVDKLVESGKVKNVADLYKLSVEDIAGLDRMSTKTGEKAINLLKAGSSVTLDTFLGGLSIPLIGKTMIKLVMSAGHDSLAKIRALSVEQLEAISGIGSVKAEALFQGLKGSEGLIDDLIKNGVRILDNSNSGLPLAGKSFCFTGEMLQKRSVLEKMALDAGGEVKSGVSKDLSFLVIAVRTSPSSKAVKARKMGIPLLSEEEFLEMVTPKVS